MKKLENKVTIITGAARGIGKSIAKLFAKEGSSLFLVSLSTAMEDFASELESEFSVKVSFLNGDISSHQFCSEVVDSCKNRYGKVDILINNAGITKDSLLIRMKEADFDSVISTNLKGAFNMSQPVAKIMMQQRSGSIINISSIIGEIGNAGQSNYAASKSGLIGFTKSLAKELGSRGIRANVITPGFISTDMTDVLSDKMKEEMINRIPLGRLGKAEDIAEGALFLASESSSYMTGAVLSINGGLSM